MNLMLTGVNDGRNSVYMLMWTNKYMIYVETLWSIFVFHLSTL